VFCEAPIKTHISDESTVGFEMRGDARDSPTKNLKETLWGKHFRAVTFLTGK